MDAKPTFGALIAAIGILGVWLAVTGKLQAAWDGIKNAGSSTPTDPGTRANPASTSADATAGSAPARDPIGVPSNYGVLTISDLFKTLPLANNPYSGSLTSSPAYSILKSAPPPPSPQFGGVPAFGARLPASDVTTGGVSSFGGAPLASVPS